MADYSTERDIGALQAKVAMLEKKFDDLQTIVKINSEKLLTSSVEKTTARKWIDRSAKLIGYGILFGLFMTAGKVTGAAELLLRLLK